MRCSVSSGGSLRSVVIDGGLTCSCSRSFGFFEGRRNPFFEKIAEPPAEFCIKFGVIGKLTFGRVGAWGKVALAAAADPAFERASRRFGMELKSESFPQAKGLVVVEIA